ncbi:hypothetical protein GCM10027028_46160 [Streptomyces sundarbansensis]
MRSARWRAWRRTGHGDTAPAPGSGGGGVAHEAAAAFDAAGRCRDPPSVHRYGTVMASRIKQLPGLGHLPAPGSFEAEPSACLT